MTDTSDNKDSSVPTHNESNVERDKRFFENLTTLRVRVGLTKTELAQRAGVGRNLITDLEKNKPVTIEKAMSVFNAVNDAHRQRFRQELDPENELTKLSRHGTRAK